MTGNRTIVRYCRAVYCGFLRDEDQALVINHIIWDVLRLL